jgi:hypothetical protein
MYPVMSITTCVVLEAATLIVPLPESPEVKELERSMPAVKLMLAVPGQGPDGQTVANPVPASWVTAMFPTTATALAGIPATAPMIWIGRGLAVSPSPARSAPVGVSRLS